ncbi:MAG: glycogen debranching enzyme, partial [Planctomycetota bacterium]
WDAAGAYQVGSFANLRWAEWNGHYRDDIRRFWRGDLGMTGAMATRLTGSSDLYQSSGRKPYHSINFITSHDGYTLNDLVCYEQKHNQANGEDNRDGDNNNYSANYGVEGPTRRRHIVELRRRQTKNMMASLLLSVGTPMIVSGDEVLRTQRGNNNAYCQDNATRWFDWTLVERNSEMLRFTEGLIEFRKRQPSVRRSTFLTGHGGENGELPDVSWYAPDGGPMHWSPGDKSLLCVMGSAGLDEPEAKNVMIIMHAGGDSQQFQIPDHVRKLPWRLLIDTAAPMPDDIFIESDGPPLPTSARIEMIHHSFCCYVA